MSLLSDKKKRVLDSVLNNSISVELPLEKISEIVKSIADKYIQSVQVNMSETHQAKALEQTNTKLILDLKSKLGDTGRNLTIGLAELEDYVKGFEDSSRKELITLKTEDSVIRAKAKQDFELVERSIRNLLQKVKDIKIPKEVKLKAGRNVSIKKEEDDNSVEYTINATAGGAPASGTFIGNVVRQIYAGNNITVSPLDANFGLTISSTGGGGGSSPYVAGTGIDVTGSTITNTLPGVSLQAGDNININGLTISAVIPGTTIYTGTGLQFGGLTLTNTLPGVSNQAGFGIAINGLTITNSLPGVSMKAGFGIDITGTTISNTITNTNLLPEGTSNFYYTESRFDTSLTTKTTNNLAEGNSGLYYSQQRFNTAFLAKNTNDLSEGTSNFYFRGDRFVGIGGASVSVTGQTVTIYAQSSGSPAWGDITGTISNQTDLQAELDLKLSGSSTTNLLTEGTSNFYFKPGYFVGTGGVSVSVVGKTVTIFGLSTALNTNQISEGVSNFYYTESRFTTSLGTKTTNDLSEGVSNFYYRPTYFLGTGGVSVSVSGKTVTLFGLSTALNTNNAVEGSSGLFYSTQRFNVDFALKNTNDLAEGTSNFYYNPLSFVGTGGASVSVTGRTVTVYGSSTAVNSNNVVEGNSALFYSSQRFSTDFALKTTNDLTEGTSRFYWRADRLVVGAGLSIFRNGVTAQVGLNVSGVSANLLNGVGTYESPIQSKSIYLEGATSTDFIPFYRVEQSMSLIKTVYDISGGTQWVGQVQRWNNAQGASKYDTQSANTGVTTTQTVTSYTGASFLQGEYIAIKGASIAGGVSWLLVNVYWRNN